MIYKIALASLLCVLISGCSSFRVIETKIPIFAKPPTANIPEPDLPIKHLNKDTKSSEVIKAYVMSVAILKRDNERFRALQINEKAQ